MKIVYSDSNMVWCSDANIIIDSIQTIPHIKTMCVVTC